MLRSIVWCEPANARTGSLISTLGWIPKLYRLYKTCQNMICAQEEFISWLFAAVKRPLPPLPKIDTEERGRALRILPDTSLV